MLKRLVIFLLVLCCVKLNAQSIRFKHLTSEEGLSTNYVTAIIQDDKGFMWFGTQEGLCRYDGYQITVYKSDVGRPSTLSSSDISTIYQHSDKKIYIGTLDEGLSIFNPFLNTFERVPVKGAADKTLSDSKVNAIVGAGQDKLWIGTSTGLNLYDIKTKTVKRVALEEGKEIEVNCLYAYDKGILVGTKEEGLWSINQNGQISRINPENIANVKINEKQFKTIRAITEYAGNFYVATYGNGVAVLDVATFEIVKVIKPFDEDRNANYIEDLEVRDNVLYAVTRDGLVVFNLIKDTSPTLLKKDDKDDYSINDNYIKTIFIDGQKNIWLGTFTGGVNVAFSQTQKFPNLQESISTQLRNAFSVYEDTDGSLWIGGEGYLRLYNRNTGKITDYSYLIESLNYVLSVNGDGENIWIGTWGLGLFKYNKSTGKKTQILNSDLGGTIITLNFDKHGRLYAGSYGDGLFVIDKSGEIKRYTSENGLSNDNITAVLFDSKKNIWLGTDGGGVCLVKGGNINDVKSIKTYVHTDSANSISSNSVYSLVEDSQGYIWMATNSGLCRFNQRSGTFTTFTEKDGLSNNFIFSVLADSLDNLWMSTNKGVSKLNPQAANINGSAIRNYDQKDGLLNIEFTQGAYAKLSNRELVFGGVNGINIFNPKKITDNFHVPPVYIVSYKRSGEDVITDTSLIYKKYLKLSWRENYFQFELAALDYNSPLKNKYMYKLEGYDKEWSAPTNIRYISYTELPGGEYTFKVKAANNDGVWNEEPYYIYITVVPPFWKTTWFYILVSVLGLAGVIIFTQLRTRAIKKENKILESKVAERTKELAEKNADITASIEYANRIQEAILPSKNDIFAKFPEAFILYKPKDIVSGDFYWFGYKNNCKIFAVVDCTGHGVPGAFMSMIGHNILNQIVMEKAITDPGQILNKLHAGVQEALKQGHNEIDTADGMDLSILSVNETTGEILWASAFRPAIIIRASGELEKLSGNRYSVGGAQLDENRLFNTHVITMNKGDIIYLFSDGYADQFGGDNGKKLMLKRFQDELCLIHKSPMNEQMNTLDNIFETWKGNREQIDDVLVVGIRF